MKKKEILMAVVSVILITVALYFVIQMLFPSKPPKKIEKESDKIPVVKQEIDEETYEIVDELNDYGLPKNDNLGKADLFSQ